MRTTSLCLICFVHVQLVFVDFSHVVCVFFGSAHPAHTLRTPPSAPLVFGFTFFLCLSGFVIFSMTLLWFVMPKSFSRACIVMPLFVWRAHSRTAVVFELSRFVVFCCS